MLGVTRAGVHIDRSACAWLIAQLVEVEAEVGFVAGPEEVGEDATTFGMGGVGYGHHGGDCTFAFETILNRCELLDPVLAASPRSSTRPTSTTNASTPPKHRGRR